MTETTTLPEAPASNDTAAPVTTAAEALEPPKRQLTPEQVAIGNLSRENDALRTIIGTMLLKRNGVLVLLQEDRKRYFALKEEMLTEKNIQPIIDVNPIRNTGNLEIRLLTNLPAKPSPDPIPIQQLEIMLKDAGLDKITYEDLEEFTALQLGQASSWVAHTIARSKGVQVDVPPRPDFLEKFATPPEGSVVVDGTAYARGPGDPPAEG